MPHFKQFTLEQRLEMFPPFLVMAMSREWVKRSPEEKRRRVNWTRKTRRQRAIADAKLVKVTPRWRRATIQEIADRSGLNFEKVKYIIRQINWDNIWVRDALKFLKACKADPCHMSYIRFNIRRSAKGNWLFKHLTNQQREALYRKIAAVKAAKEQVMT